PLALSDGGSVVRGDKVLWSGSRLITLSSRPCCRGGVRACVVCAYLGIVTWAGREVTITIWLLYRSYTIEASPVNSLQGTAVRLPRTKRDNGPHPAQAG